MALRKVWVDQIDRTSYAFASIQATLYNAHFDTKGTPWTAEDLMGRGNRQARIDESLKAKIQTSRMIAEAKNSVPEWALEIERDQKRRVN